MNGALRAATGPPSRRRTKTAYEAPSDHLADATAGHGGTAPTAAERRVAR